MNDLSLTPWPWAIVCRLQLYLHDIIFHHVIFMTNERFPHLRWHCCVIKHLRGHAGDIRYWAGFKHLCTDYRRASAPELGIKIQEVSRGVSNGQTVSSFTFKIQSVSHSRELSINKPLDQTNTAICMKVIVSRLKDPVLGPLQKCALHSAYSCNRNIHNNNNNNAVHLVIQLHTHTHWESNLWPCCLLWHLICSCILTLT